MKNYLVEAIGTFFLVFTIAMVAVLNTSAGALAPFAIGSVLMAMVYAGGPISGGHYNPAVSLAILLRGAMPKRDFLPYVVAQLLGASLAGLLAIGVYGGGTAVTPMSLSVPQALLAELLFTFALVWVILNVATVKARAGNSYFGLAIGLTVTAGAYAVGGVSGAVFNPAVALALSLMGASAWVNIWIYLVANCLAAVLALTVFRFIHGEEKDV